MNNAIDTALALPPPMHVHVLAIAAIVQELGSGREARQPGDGRRWLRARAAAAGLDAHERAALEALHARLCENGASLLETMTNGQGTW